MIKKLNAALVILCILLVFAACGKEPGDPTGTTGSTNGELTSSAGTTTAPAEVSADPKPDESEPPVSAPAKSAPSTPIQTADSSAPAGTTGKTTTSGSIPSSKPADTPTKSSKPTDPPVIISDAKSTDGAAIANKIIEYINQYRVAQGAGAATKLPGLTQVAEYRSRQLVTNYKHDLTATREATRYYKYGEHIVYEEYGLDYYDAHSAEAIGRSGSNYTIDEVANIMATGFKNSSGHWDYVGSASYKYIAVGATYGNGQWYV